MALQLWYSMLYVALVISISTVKPCSGQSMNEGEVFTCQSLSNDIPELLELSKGAWTLENIQSCAASGLVCDGSGRITSVRIGPISRPTPLPEQFSKLPQLKTIEIIGSVTGTLPSSWSSLHNLEAIELIGSKVMGDIPSSWAELEHLSTLNIDFEEHSTSKITLPPFLSNLTRIALNGATLSHFPEFVDSSSALTTFILKSATIEAGSLPDAIWTNPNLAILEIDLSKKSHTFGLDAFIPSDLTPMRGLVSLSLSGFAIGGSIPSQWPGGFAMLNLIDLPFLNGTLPQSLMDHPGIDSITLEKLPNVFGDLIGPKDTASSTITHIKIEDIALDGSISPLIMSLPKLTSFTLASCKTLKGPLPGVLVEEDIIYSVLASVNFTANPSLGGTIHESFANINSLEQLILDGNGLIGSIPRTFAAFESPNLYWLSISNNPTTGPLPDLDFGLSRIAPVLNLRGAGLEGTIPTSLLAASYRRFDLSGNNMSLCDDTESQSRDESRQKFKSVECDLSGIPAKCAEQWPLSCFPSL